MKKVVVIALGGNALQAENEKPTYENQMKNIETATNNIIELIKSGYKVVVTHGNGPQVGRLLIQNEKADSEETPAFPFDAVDAMSQATIGYQIAQSLQMKLQENNLDQNAVAVLTQIAVDKDDAGFQNPTKPIGPFYTEEQAKVIAEEKGYTIKPDSDRGYRRVVASPQPIKIIEEKAIKNLIDNDNVVVCCGGGGIPVFLDGDKITGTAAVIDKDQASNLLAKQIKADYLIILTAVPEAAINYGKPNQESIKQVTTDELETYIAEEQFAKGSMLPKVEAVVDFVKTTNNTAIITTLDNVQAALETGNVGTIVSNK